MLKVLSGQGFTIDEVGALLGFKRTTVIKKNHKLALTFPAPFWTDGEISLLLDMYEHLGNAELAELLGRSPKAVEQKLVKMRKKRSSTWFVSRGLTFLACPPELREVIRLNSKLSRHLKNEEHRRSS